MLGTGSTNATRRADPQHDLALLVRSHYALVHLETPEEELAEAHLRELASELDLPLFVWKPTKGLRRAEASNSVYATESPAGVLGYIALARVPAIYHLRDFGGALRDPCMVARLREAAAPFANLQGVLVLTGADFELPEPLWPMGVVIELAAPDIDDIDDSPELLQTGLQDPGRSMPVQSEPSEADVGQLMHNLPSPTLVEDENPLARPLVEDAELSPQDIAPVIEAKGELVQRDQELVQSDGLLECSPVVETLADVAGMRGLQAWLQERRGLFQNPKQAAAFGFSFPRGILILGVPGCGRRLGAKAVAGEWKLPLLKFDPTILYDKYIEESERNLMRALGTAESCAPVVLWIDDVETAFACAGAQHDDVTSARLFGTFLTWLQEHDEPVFVVATANDVTQLPAEFLGRGRFDEIFFADLPDAAARVAILSLQLRRHGQRPGSFDLATLAVRTQGFGVTEIEQCVLSALSARCEPTTEALLQEIGATVPLWVTMGERIAALRAWAQGRVRRAY